jgi:hypothetical protein
LAKVAVHMKSIVLLAIQPFRVLSHIRHQNIVLCVE